MRRPLALLLLISLAALSPSASAQDPFGPSGAGGGSSEKDESTPDYLKALETWRAGHWKEAQKAFQEVLKKYPKSVHADDCEMRGGANCYLGVVKLHESGPSARRIDVSVMGDGFLVDPKQQAMEEDWARSCLAVLDSEAAYTEYQDYFNYYYVRLGSKEEGVDEVLSDAELKKREDAAEKKHKTFKAPKEYSTALDCKAAGPQKQVMSDHDLVYQWLAYANADVPGCGDDGLVIVFAKFGALGMAELGNGLANCGKPSNSVTVHEFGHAFVGLLDEYAINPNPPGYPIHAINATTDPKEVPWQHFLDKKVKGVGVIEGGATYQKGVWRPSATCAMNAAGAGNGYCPVCREAAVLRIYATVSPIDKASQDPFVEMKCVDGDESKLVITPMQPKTHALKCEWFVDRVPDSDPGPKRPADGTTSDGQRASANGSHDSSTRSVGRDGSLYEYPPLGTKSDLGQETKSKTEGVRFVFPTGKLGRGRWEVTCKVWDTAEWPALKNGPAVLKDTQHLLEERETFFVDVATKK
jgi:hypothetical protein